MQLDKGAYGSPRWTYEILDCAMPMTFDTYSNCAHQCTYCFSFFQRAVGQGADDYLHHKVRSVNVERVKRMFTNPNKYGGQFKNYIKARMVLQWGGLSDGFDWYEKKFLKSLELLEFFCDINYPVSISTKGVWFVQDERYRKVLKNAKNVHFKYSIITADEEHVRLIEPGVPSTKERFEAMKELGKLGIGATTLRFRPFIIGTSDKHTEKLFKMAKDAGCYSVTTEFLGWESRAGNTSRARLEIISKVVGYDVWKFYLENSNKASGLMRLNYDLKRPYIKQMKELAEKYDLKFFVSDAHHKQESYHAGCCGLPETGPLSKVNHGQYAHAIKIAKDKGFVHWSDISDEAKYLLKDVPLFAAEGFPTDTVIRMQRRYQTMFDYMHDIWNNPKSWQSPARYFGGALVPSQPDENGDIVYLYNKPFIEDGTRIESVNQLAIHLKMAGKDNAERFDEMTADGGDFGHIAYPVYVFSRKRWNTASTMQLLTQSKINYTLVVSKEDYEEYADRYPEADIIVTARKDNIRLARQEIFERASAEGYPYVWMLDDDIEAVYKSGKKSTMRALMSGLERWMQDYTNVGMLGVSGENKTIGLNEPMEGIYLLCLLTGIDFSKTKVDLYDNYAIALDMLSTGKWVTVNHHDYSVGYKEADGGGVSHIRIRELTEPVSAKVLEQKYKGRVTALPNGGIQLSFVGFDNSLRSVHVDELLSKPKPKKRRKHVAS